MLYTIWERYEYRSSKGIEWTNWFQLFSIKPTENKDELKITEIEFLGEQSTDLQNLRISNQGGIIAFIHDIDSCASIITRFRDYSYPNNRDESMNIIKKADKGYMVDLSENAVVFYVANAA